MTFPPVDLSRVLRVGSRQYRYVSLEAAVSRRPGQLTRLPYALRTLLENLLRHPGPAARDGVEALLDWGNGPTEARSLPFHPARVLMQDFTGVPCLVDLAAMRDAVAAGGGDAARVNPVIPVDFVLDHSLVVEHAASPDAMARNTALEYDRNRERFAFMRWAKGAFRNLRLAVPGTGIVHQINLEHIAQVVWTSADGAGEVAYPDTLVGTDSHTTMINALGVLGWGVGGIEAEAAMLGQPLAVGLPEVVGVRLTGRPHEGVGAADVVLSLTERLRRHGVVEKFVEFTGEGVARLSVADRATIANMAPEYGSTCAFFPIDRTTLDYLALTGRDPERIVLVEAYAKAQHLWRDEATPEPVFTETLTFDLGSVEPCVAGPRRPQQRTALSDVPSTFRVETGRVTVDKRAGRAEALGDGAVVIAAITSCTHTSNPASMIAAGLLARRAAARGLRARPWVKTSLTPGSRVVASYLAGSGLQRDLDALGFHLTGFGCGTCAGASGSLDGAVEAEIAERDLVACAVLSGNRNFEGRIHPQVRAAYLASPALVVAYAIAGRVTLDLATEALGHDRDGRPVMLADLWPGDAEIQALLREAVTPELFRSRYASAFGADERWNAVPLAGGDRFEWHPDSTYIQRPPYFDAAMPGASRGDVHDARPLLILGDGVTTDHISPAGAISPTSPAGRFLLERGVAPGAFNAYGARRSNHDVMVRGTFANLRLRNEMMPGREGGITRHMPDGTEMTVYEAAMAYLREGTPVVIVAGRDYGAGSSRDWAAKGARLLGVRAVIAESFERIHRSNLVSMGVLPLVFPDGVTQRTLGLDGSERFSLFGLGAGLRPRASVEASILRCDGSEVRLTLGCRLDGADDLRVWKAGGILPHVLARLDADAAA